MRCPWQTVEDTYGYLDGSKLNKHGTKKVTTFGECIKAYCPFYNSEERSCNRANASTGRMQNDLKEGTAEEEPHWIKQIYSDGGYNHLCSSCRETSLGDNSKYCPNCGKKMSDVVYRRYVDSEHPDIMDIDDGT